MAIATKKTAAIALAAGLAVSGSAGTLTAPIAFAQDATAETAGAGINDSRSMSLTLHKKRLTNNEQPGDKATGQPMEGVPGEGLSGVTYRLDLIKPLETTKDWQEANQLWESSKDGGVLGLTAEQANVANGETNNDGELKFDGLAKGLYRVVETSAPAGVVPGAPFLVYVPMTNSEGTDWIYDVHAYPKNTENTVKKEVKDEWANAGDKYTYTLTTGVPAGKLTKYVVRDVLDEQLEAPKAGDVEVEGFAAGTDYNVVINGQTIEVVFTDAGLAKLQAGTNVVTTINAIVKAGVQHIANQGTLIYNNGSSDSDVEHPTDKVHSYWGSLEITKTNEGDTPLKGAEFQLVRCEQTAGSAGETTWTQLANTGAQSAYVGETKTDKFVTGDDGKVTISGIHVSDFENNSSAAVNTQLCLKETKAPAGYIASDKLTPFELKRGEVDENGKPTVAIKPPPPL
ncbi:SpaH/EbpB family LPXTG-anchored major pilin [Corynebacterium aquatimens]|uniref:SpaH/EbpB family LPXTG-anchored major pilin n=1 Tax=Corynebacterium aquatimens TaxID=1190508 RepID=UPI0025404BE9|nr:SpaH/EbpB family LPXTG-anchored major pilin [Corynebacterium aquatimens]QYH19206.1 SpaH/EbpB family LPXTG-anchored major pilin [Corynebacterium aquatimens]